MKGKILLILVASIALGYFWSQGLLPSLWANKKLRSSTQVLRVKQPAPNFDLVDVNGFQLNLSEMTQTLDLIVVHIWAVTNEITKQELQLFNKLHDKYRSRGFTPIAINSGQDAGLVFDVIETMSLTYHVVADTRGQMTDLFGVESLPTTVLIDSRGVVIKIVVGSEPTLLDDLIRKYMKSLE